MPTYEYQCRACNHHLEVFQKITEDALTECPQCHQSTLGKLISATNFQLKGTGWYATDIRDKGKPKNTQTDTKTDTKSDSTDQASGTSTASSSDTSKKTAEKE